MSDPFGVLGANALTRAVSARVLSTADRVRRPPLREVGRMAAPLWPEATDRLVTVAVPNFNYGAYLPDAVASAVAQRGVAVEVVIVDDCSTDDSFAVAQSLAARYDNVVALQNDVNQGHGRTFNRAWRAGRGEFVVRLDADDILAPDALARSVALFERFDDVGLVYGRVAHFCGDPPEPEDGAAATGLVWSGADWSYRMLQDDRNLIATPEAMLRRSVMEKYGAWKPELPHSQDLEMWLRAASFFDVGYVRAVQAYKRFHEASMNLQGSAGTGLFHAHRHAYESWYGDVADRVADADLRYAVGRQAVADHAIREAVHAYRRGKADRVPVAELKEIAETLVDQPSGLRALERYERATAVLGPSVVKWSPPALVGSIRERLRQAGIQARLDRDGY